MHRNATDTFNYDITKVQLDSILNSGDYKRNVTHLGLNDQFRNYPLLEDPLTSKAKIKVDGIESSKITSVSVVDSGTEYKVNDKINFNDPTITASVDQVIGKPIVSVGTTNTIVDNLKFSIIDGKVTGVSTIPHGLFDGDIVSGLVPLKEEVINIASSGTVSISKWTSKLNKTILNNLGHKEYFLNLKHAAYSSSKKILLVNRGVDITRPLSAQNDCFWWGYQNFSNINKPYKSFSRIVRGYQSKHNNEFESAKSKIVCTLFKQPLSNNLIYAGIFSENGEILEIFESN